MSNMSYCRYENTARDLADCLEALRNEAQTGDELSESELRARTRLLELCKEITENAADYIEEWEGSRRRFSEDVFTVSVDGTLFTAEASDLGGRESFPCPKCNVELSLKTFEPVQDDEENELLAWHGMCSCNAMIEIVND